MKSWIKKTARGLLIGLGLLSAAPLAYAAYTATMMNDGVNLWSWTANGTGQVALQADANPAAFTIDKLGGPMVPFSTVALLPACVAALKGAIRMVTDATTPTYNGALTGGSTVIVPVSCSGAAWTSH